jgi:hypothetical protein
MPSTSALLNKPLRSTVAPLLRESGFQHVDPRNGWCWRDDSIWVFNIRAVGGHFSGATGWPPGSVSVWLGVFFTFTPRPLGLKTDSQGRLRPPEHACHIRSRLHTSLDQSSYVQQLRTSPERKRTDIWWLQPDGGNAEEVARDIAAALLRDGVPWYKQNADLANALERARAEHDCFTKFVRVALLAKRVGDHALWREYDALAEAEAFRIGRSQDRSTWFGI